MALAAATAVAKYAAATRRRNLWLTSEAARRPATTRSHHTGRPAAAAAAANTTVEMQDDPDAASLIGHAHQRRVVIPGVVDRTRFAPEVVPGETFDNQFAVQYVIRMASFRALLLAPLQAATGPNSNCVCFDSVSQITRGVRGAVIATICRTLAKAKSILEMEMVGYERNPDPYEPFVVVADAKVDEFHVEDETQRAKARFVSAADLKWNHGATAVLCGTMDGDDVFHITDVILPGASFPRLRAVSGQECLVVIISGVHFEETPTDAELQQALHASLRDQYKCLIPTILQYVVGSRPRGDAFLRLEAFVRSTRSVHHVIMAGNMLSPPRTRGMATFMQTLEVRRRATKLVQEFDSCIARLARFVKVYIMPGWTDVGRASLPQEPFPSLMLPKACTHTETFEVAPNPMCLHIGPCSVLGTSGQSVLDLMMHSGMPDPISAMKYMLEQRHMGITDTLTLRPRTRVDPLLLPNDVAPDVFFAGNQRRFETGTLTSTGAAASKITCVAVPVFRDTSTVAVVDVFSGKATAAVL